MDTRYRMSANKLLGLAIIALLGVVDCRLENHFTVSNLVVSSLTTYEVHNKSFAIGARRNLHSIQVVRFRVWRRVFGK